MNCVGYNDPTNRFKDDLTLALKLPYCSKTFQKSPTHSTGSPPILYLSYRTISMDPVALLLRFASKTKPTIASVTRT